MLYSLLSICYVDMYTLIYYVICLKCIHYIIKVTLLMHLSMLTPRGGGRAKGGDLINQVVPWVGIWTDTFSKWPEGGDF
jgi:hypothetical protein